MALSSVGHSSVLCHMHLNWVSMSTRQIGQCLLVASHWSTQSRWNKCMHGKRLENGKKIISTECKARLASKSSHLTSLSISNWERQIVHFSLSSSASLSRRSFLYLCGSVCVSIVSWVAPRFARSSITLTKRFSRVSKLSGWLRRSWRSLNGEIHCQLLQITEALLSNLLQ